MDTTTNETTYALTRALNLVMRQHAAEMEKAEMAWKGVDLDAYEAAHARAEGLRIAIREIRTLRDGNDFVRGL